MFAVHGIFDNNVTNSSHDQRVALAVKDLCSGGNVLGYGQKHVMALTGHCGTVDVMDCIELERCLIEKGLTKEGPGYHFIYGGSHGGFLGAHRKSLASCEY